jgi:WD40 repeat protein
MKKTLFYALFFSLSQFIYAQTYTLVDTVGPFQSSVKSALFSPNGKYVAVLLEDSKDVYVYEGDSNKLISTLTPYNGGKLNQIAWSPSGTYISAGGSNGMAIVFEWKKSKVFKTIYPDGKLLSTPDLKINFTGFGRKDDEFFFGGDDKKITLVKNMIKVPSISSLPMAAEEISCGAVSPDREMFAYASKNLLYLKNLLSGEFKVIAGSSDIITAIAFANDKKRVAVRCIDKMVDFWNYKTNDKTRSIKDAGQPKSNDYTGIALSNDLRYIATGSINNNPAVWDDDYRNLYNLYGHTGSVNSVDFSQDSRQLATGSNDKYVYLWYISDGQFTMDQLKKQKRNPLTAKTRVVSTKSPTGEDSKMSFQGDSLPVQLNDRNIKPTNAITVSSKNITFYVWDDDQIDGDVISLNLNNVWILSNYKLTKQKKIVTAKINPGGNNYLMLFAHNEGAIAPNTAGISIFDGYKEVKLNLKSDLHSCDAVRLILK